MQKSIGYGLIILGWLGFSACGKESVSMKDDTLSSYMNLQPGKYIIYQLDSIVKVSLTDVALDTVSYEAKDVIDSLITDNLNRPSWRVFRYIRPLGSTSESAWESSDTYYITPTRGAMEVVENNLRFQKLVYPVKENVFWKGNTFINTTPGDPLDYLDSWEYYYTAIDQPYAPIETMVDSTVTIVQTDQNFGFADDVTPVDISSPGYRFYSVEVYAKNIGLIYRYTTHFTFIERNPSNPRGKLTGNAIRLRMISHN